MAIVAGKPGVRVTEVGAPFGIALTPNSRVNLDTTVAPLPAMIASSDVVVIDNTVTGGWTGAPPPGGGGGGITTETDPVAEADLATHVANTTTAHGINSKADASATTTALAAKADASATTAALAGKAATSHTHVKSDITDIKSAILAADLAAIAAQTSLQDITGLALAIGASATEIWQMKGFLIFTGVNGAMDAKVGFSVPTGCTMKWGMDTLSNQTTFGGWGVLSAASTPNTIATESSAIPFASVNGVFLASFTAIIFGGGTAGNVQPRYAQNTSDAGNLQVLKGSMIRSEKMAA